MTQGKTFENLMKMLKNTSCAGVLENKRLLLLDRECIIGEWKSYFHLYWTIADRIVDVDLI